MTTNKVFDGTPKGYCESIGIGKSGRGRPTAAQVEAIAKFRSDGGTFTSETDKPAPKRAADKPKRADKVTKPVTVEPKQTESPAGVDTGAVRAWAQEKGIEVASRGRLNLDLVARYLADVPEDERPERRVEMYGPTPPDVNPPGTVYVYTSAGKPKTTTAGNGRAACMKSGYSVVACGNHAGAHRILVADERNPVDIVPKRN